MSLVSTRLRLSVTLSPTQVDRLTEEVSRRLDGRLRFIADEFITRSELMAQELSALKLPSRLLLPLYADGIKTVRQLCSFSREELLRIPRLGPKTVSLIISELECRGLQLRRQNR